MTDDDVTRPFRHVVGQYATHQAWSPAPLRIPDDPLVGIHVTNVHENDQVRVMNMYHELHPYAHFSIGEPRTEQGTHTDTLKAHNIVGIYANRKTNG